MAASIKTNSTSAASVLYLRKNQNNTVLSVTITAGTTGTFEDTSSKVNYVDGDDICMFLDIGDASGLQFYSTFVSEQPTLVINSDAKPFCPNQSVAIAAGII
jgi:hypothetical protein